MKFSPGKIELFPPGFWTGSFLWFLLRLSYLPGGGLYCVLLWKRDFAPFWREGLFLFPWTPLWMMVAAIWTWIFLQEFWRLLIFTDWWRGFFPHNPFHSEKKVRFLLAGVESQVFDSENPTEFHTEQREFFQNWKKLIYLTLWLPLLVVQGYRYWVNRRDRD